MRDLPIGVFPYLDDGEVQLLSKSVSNEEIMATLFYTTPLKALGSDGYHALFY